MILPFCPTKHTIQTSSEKGRNASVQLPPTPFWPFLGHKSCYRKSDQTKMGTRTPRPIWTNAVGQCNGLIMHGCPHQTGHVLCHHIIINMGVDDYMIDVILNINKILGVSPSRSMGDRIFVATTTVDVNATLKLFGGLSFVSIVVADHNHHRRHQHPPSPHLLLHHFPSRLRTFWCSHRHHQHRRHRLHLPPSTSTVFCLIVVY